MLFTLVSARGAPSEAYICKIDISTMPEKTKYVDMLLPTCTEDKRFTTYNVMNGARNNISENSQIVQYNENGFYSYTFRMKDAHSQITLSVEDENTAYVCFLQDDYGYDPFSFPDIDIFGEKYQKAKFAYLDINGNILGLTNEIDIWNDYGYADLFLSLSGAEASCEMERGLLNFDFRPFFYATIIILSSVIVTFLITLLQKTVFNSKK